MSSARRLTLVRHADALARAEWTEPDARRPLSAKGERQADGLAEALRDDGALRLLTSPAKRCADTLAPLARATGLALEDEPLLLEGTAPGTALGRLLDALEGLEGCAALPAVPPGARRAPALVACSHGDVLDGIVRVLLAGGTPLSTGDAGPLGPATPKAARWEIDVEDGSARAARLVRAPGAPAR